MEEPLLEKRCLSDPPDLTAAANRENPGKGRLFGNFALKTGGSLNRTDWGIRPFFLGAAGFPGFLAGKTAPILRPNYTDAFFYYPPKVWSNNSTPLG